MLFLLVAGCGLPQRQWELSVKNDSPAPASFFVTLAAGASNAKIENVAAGSSVSILVGQTDTVLDSVRVLRGEDEKTLHPRLPLPVGRRCTISVAADGVVDVSIKD
jgi:hypothetical protein